MYHVSRASDVIVVWCSDWCALGCSATVVLGCVCSSHVSGWLTSVEVFAVVPLGVSCFLSCWVGRILCGPLERWDAGRLFHRGIRIQAAAASCAHVSCSGGREPVVWVQMQLTRNRHFLVFSKYEKKSALLAAAKDLNIRNLSVRSREPWAPVNSSLPCRPCPSLLPHQLLILAFPSGWPRHRRPSLVLLPSTLLYSLLPRYNLRNLATIFQ